VIFLKKNWSFLLMNTEESLNEAINMLKDMNQRIKKLEAPNHIPVIIIGILLLLMFVFIIIFYDREVYHRAKEKQLMNQKLE